MSVAAGDTSRRAYEAAVLACARRRGLRITRQACIHRPARAGCPECTEVALRLVLDEITEAAAEFDNPDW